MLLERHFPSLGAHAGTRGKFKGFFFSFGESERERERPESVRTPRCAIYVMFSLTGRDGLLCCSATDVLWSGTSPLSTENCNPPARTGTRLTSAKSANCEASQSANGEIYVWEPGGIGACHATCRNIPRVRHLELSRTPCWPATAPWRSAGKVKCAQEI